MEDLMEGYENETDRTCRVMEELFDCDPETVNRILAHVSSWHSQHWREKREDELKEVEGGGMAIKCPHCKQYVARIQNGIAYFEKPGEPLK